MQHDISEEQWMEYSEGGLDADERRRIRAHLDICTDCSETLSRLTACHQRLALEASRLRSDLAVPDAELSALLSKCLEQIRDAGTAADSTRVHWTVREAMMLIRLLVEPICGVGTARALLSLAVKRSTATDQDSVTGSNWRLFVSNMSDAITSVCGSATGRLVNRVGGCLAIGEG